MGCAFTTPEEQEAFNISVQIDKDLKKLKCDRRRHLKLLLLGTGESGKSTIVKQMKIIHDGGYNNEERREHIKYINRNVTQSIKTILCAMQSLKIQFTHPNMKAIADELLSRLNMMDDADLPKQIGDMIQTLWTDPGVQECVERSREYQLSDCARYYLSDVLRLCEPGYVPTEQDVLRARVKTTGIIEFNFQFKDVTFTLVDVGGQRSERRKWIHCFEGVTGILFVSSLSEYDLRLLEDEEKMRMIESLELFDAICNNPFFLNTAIILFLNKKDIFEQKIQKSPLTLCFPEYGGPNTYEDGCEFIKEQFLCRNRRRQKANDVVNENGNPRIDQRLLEIYFHFTDATDTDHIKRVTNTVNDNIFSLNVSKIAFDY